MAPVCYNLQGIVNRGADEIEPCILSPSSTVLQRLPIVEVSDWYSSVTCNLKAGTPITKLLREQEVTGEGSQELSTLIELRNTHISACMDCPGDRAEEAARKVRC
ncbi:hypothetical protein C0Q70_05689 [Pomacea canaliculata]|uniref:Uncharacterized protein n=1 Tax=Pomacea canaliculata TaxID=400727 RepID=A0A2T7PLW3_POMCA|nr:hypothetical protein C0Q70_05689 [Pomacea canaliculata]